MKSKTIRGNGLLRKLTPVQKISISFLGVILVGSILLCLPIANKDGNALAYIDALFTAASATCVTGLTTIVPVDQFNLFGQTILIFLMQIGGIGLMTLVASFVLMLKNRLSLRDKQAMKEVLNETNISNFKWFIGGILKYTFTLELVGMAILCFVFIPEKGVFQGLYTSLFTAVSAFCNAGFDIVGVESLIPYQSNPIVCFVVMGLIVFGGLGFVVWFDLRDKFKQFLTRKVSFRQFHHSLTLHTKLVIIATVALILIPSIIFYITEYNNPETMGNMNFFERAMNALFTSVTLRTAGFATISAGEMYMSSQFLMMICMFIGGSPGGTAGGIKTTTMMVILFCVVRSLRGKKHTNAFRRHISRDIIVRATTIVAINVVVLFTGIFLLLVFEPFPMHAIAFEAVSAMATVGLTVGITMSLSTVGKLIIIALMFVGRVGIMTFVMSLVRKDNTSDKIHYAEGHVIIG